MPELPEVETMYRQIAPILNGATIVDSRSYHKRFPKLPSLTIDASFRFGKWIILRCADKVVMMNLGMSGGFIVGASRPKHIKWEILLQTKGGRKRALRFVDPRGFGRLIVYQGKMAQLVLQKNATTFGVPEVRLGPDLMSWYMRNEPATKLLPRWKQQLDTKIPIKTALMDQSRLAGLGNIYASELCWLAKVHPERPANQLTSQELLLMIAQCTKMLEKAILVGGTSFGDANSFRDLQAHEGNYSQYLKVYGKEGERCKCGGTIEKVKMGGRSTFFCNNCQK